MQDVSCCISGGESVPGERRDWDEGKCSFLRVQYAHGHYLEATRESKKVQRE